MDVSFTIDIEPTNRCNAKCHFCPRDATPHQGLMSPEVFAQSLARAVEFRDTLDGVVEAGYLVSLCGLGEPLLNPNIADYVRQVREAGFDSCMSSNGALLDERRATALLDAGLQRIYINAGESDQEYDDIYKLPFGKTRDNVVRFVELAADRCHVELVIVDHRRDRDHVRRMKDYWSEYGITSFTTYDIMNRGGALFVDDMQFAQYPESGEAARILAAAPVEAACAAPFAYQFIGWDGRYYLCCSDWKKEVPLASVFDTTLLAVTHQKLAHVRSREPICRTCNHDPVNRVTEELRAVNAGTVTPRERDKLLDEINAHSQAVWDLLDQLRPVLPEEPIPVRRRAIPVIAS